MWQKTGIGEGDSIIILIGFKIIILLFAVNATPPVIAFLLEDRWNRPIDWNRTFFDGKPLLGCHKTIRGIIGSIAAGILLGWFFGLPIIVGFCIGSFSMLGDLLTGFLKLIKKYDTGVRSALDVRFRQIELRFRIYLPRLIPTAYSLCATCILTAYRELLNVSSILFRV